MTLDPDHLITNRVFNLVEHYKQGDRFVIRYRCSKCGKESFTGGVKLVKCPICSEPNPKEVKEGE